MFLNETKPPLDEAISHFGVRGMKWGVRRKSETRSEDEDFDLSPDRPNRHTGAKIAAAGVVVAGALASAYILKNHGSLPTSSIKIPKSPFAGKTFTPKDVGNPLWTRNPKEAKDFVDAGFGKNGVFNVTTMKRGAKTVKDFDANIWETPMRAIASGRG